MINPTTASVSFFYSSATVKISSTAWKDANSFEKKQIALEKAVSIRRAFGHDIAVGCDSAEAYTAQRNSRERAARNNLPKASGLIPPKQPRPFGGVTSPDQWDCGNAFFERSLLYGFE